jgi:hypothetical protein
MFLEWSDCDLESLRGPVPVHALCVAGGTHRAFNFLLGAGIGLNSTDSGTKALLHHVGPKTGKEFVLQLVRMSQEASRFRIVDKLPLDAYLENCISSEPPALDSDVLYLLATPISEDFIQREKKLVWEHFALSVQNVSPIWRTDEGELGPIDWTREKVTAKAVSMLLKLGFVHSYEAIAHIAGVLPLLKRLRYDLHDLWPVSSEAIRGLLKHTTLWERLREPVAVTKLLKAAVKASDVELTDALLENGVSVHQRISECSALEVACLNHAEGSDAKHIFTLLLDRAEPLHLDEINPCPDRGLGLIHYLVGREKEWQLDELLKRGIDVNLRTSIDNGGGPAVVWHLWERSLKSAMTLLDRGANPTMVDNDGVDTALAAAAQGGLDILVRLRTNLRQNWQVKWRQTCIIFIEGAGDFDLSVSGANGLHLAAWQGHCDVLGFYIDNGLLTDLDAASVELFTPMHLAAFQGEIDMVRLLYSKGGHLNLKSADGSLPFHLAVGNEHSEVVKFLVENGSVMDSDIHGIVRVASEPWSSIPRQEFQWLVGHSVRVIQKCVHLVSSKC